MEKRSNPATVPITRTRLRQLAEQFAVEYAGAVAPGRVMSLVFTTGRRLQLRGLDGDDLLLLTKLSVRIALVTIIGEAIAHGLTGDGTYPSDAGHLRLVHS